MHGCARPLHVRPRVAVWAVPLLAAFGCSDATAPKDGVIERAIAPSTADPTLVTSYDNDSYVWFAPAALGDNRQLLVLLSGSGGQPANFRGIGHLAALQGWQAIGLMYPDEDEVYEYCGDPQDSTCASNIRTEKIDGVDASPYLSIDRANSISGRLVSLLRYLAARYPNEGWDAYLAGDAPRWTAIAVGGLSQGGGHAAFIARSHPVPRVLMFGSPTDGYRGRPAAWMTPGATDASRYYGFIHLRDPFISEVPNWVALGMDAFGPVVAVDGSDPPYGGSHMLMTDLLPSTGSYGDAHASVFNDHKTPRTSGGAAVFAPVWTYMIGTPTGTGGAGIGGPSPSRAAAPRPAGTAVPRSGPGGTMNLFNHGVP